jgi:hypothetical protein
VFNLYYFQSREGAEPDRKLAVPTLREQLQVTELELMSSGVRKTVHGRELLRRWHDWRRGDGEFEGQGSYEEALKALCLMYGRLAESGRQAPELYYEVMGVEKREA